MKLRRALLVALLVVAAATYLWAVRRDLPYAAGNDEVDFLMVVAQMGIAGDPNPHWFGHPGSTFIYPYAAGLKGWSAVTQGGTWLGADPEFADALSRHQGVAILVGRLVSVTYGVLALWMICLVGDRACGPPAGLIAGWLALLSPLTFDHVDMARTDGAGLFFGFLAIWAMLRLLQEPSRGGHVLAGVTLGFAIGTRFFLAGLIPLLLVVDVLLVSRASAEDRSLETKSAAIGGLCILAGLVVSAPFLFLEVGEVVANLAHETRGSHPGADGLDTFGNIGWYLTVALPRSVPTAVLVLAAAGAVLAAIRREIAPLLLGGFVVIFLSGISLATLHWGRWLIQILPLFSILAAGALVWIVSWGVRQLGGTARTAAIVLALCTLAVSARPAWTFFQHVGTQAGPSTRDESRAWIVAHLDPAEQIAADLYTAPLQHTPFEDTDYVFSLAQVTESPEELRARGYDIAMVSNAVYGRFFATPKRYPKEIAFYRGLFRRHELVVEFRPGPGGRGPVIRLYRLGPGPNAAKTPE